MIANALMQQGMDASPVQHWSQGLNRVAQALLGGYRGNQAEQAAMTLQKQEEAKAAAARAEAQRKAQMEAQQPVYKYEGGQWWNVNPNLQNPLAVSQATQKKDEMTAYQRAQLELRRKEQEWKMSQPKGGGKESSGDREAAKLAKEYVASGDSAADALSVADQLDKIGDAPSLDRAIGPLQGSSTLQTITDNVPIVGGMLGNAGGNAQIKNLTAKLEAQMGRVLNKGLGPQSDADAQRVVEAVGKLPYARSKAEYKMLVKNIKADLAKIKSRGDVARKRYPEYDFSNSFEQAPQLDGPALAPANGLKAKYGLE